MSARSIAFWLMILLGISAASGGLMLVMASDGALLGMPVSLLDGTPFQNYLIPGLILFLILGVGSLLALAAFRNHPARFAGSVLVEGAALIIWVVTQVALIGPVHIMQPVMLLLGIVLFGLGWRLWACQINNDSTSKSLR